jgi:hypothetical protein
MVGKKTQKEDILFRKHNLCGHLFQKFVDGLFRKHRQAKKMPAGTRLGTVGLVSIKGLCLASFNKLYEKFRWNNIKPGGLDVETNRDRERP